MKAILAIGLLSLFMTACSSSDKKTMKDQTVKAAEEAKTDMQKATEAATAPTAESIMRIECSSGKESRVIAIDKNGANGCLVNYTKNGDSKQVARSQVGHTYCKEVSNRIQSNLKNAGFSCQ